VKSGWGVERPGFNPASPPKVVDPVIYGESIFVRRMAELLGVRLVEPDDDWITRLPENVLRREVFCTTLQDAYILKYPAFVKPAGEKGFAAKVYESGDELRHAAAAFEPELRVLVSDPVKFEVEFRCFVLKNRIATASIYMRDGQLAEDSDESELNEAVLFAHGVVYRTEDCPDAFVLDVGRIAGRGWAVVEANPCWGAGLCQCDEDQVLRVLEHSLIRGRPS
jgi:hypothetical protein